MSLGYRDYKTLDDKLTSTSPHTSDNLLDSYALSISPRPLSWWLFGYTAKLDGTRTESFTDTVDKVLPSDSTVDYYHMGNTFNFTSRVNWNLDYQVNKSDTISYEAGGHHGSLEAKTESDDLSSNLNWDLTFGPFKRLYAYWNKQGHNDYDFLSGAINSTLNETYHADFVPIDQVTTSMDHNRQETPTVSTVYGNPKTETTSANIRVAPFSNTSLGWSGSETDALQAGGIKTSGSTNTYSVNNTPLSEANYKLTTGYVLTTTLAEAPLGTEEVSTDSRDFSQNYVLTYNPIPAWTLTSGFVQDDFATKNNSKISSVETNSQSQTINVGTAYQINPDLNVSANFGVKVTRIPDMSAHVGNADAHAVYRVFANGTLNYDWVRQDNGGEIVGGVFNQQDFTQIIQTFSFNMAMPQNEQFILSSIVIKAAWKLADYTDRMNRANDYKAQLITFDGTLNF